MQSGMTPEIPLLKSDLRACQAVSPRARPHAPSDGEPDPSPSPAAPRSTHSQFKVVKEHRLLGKPPVNALLLRLLRARCR